MSVVIVWLMDANDARLNDTAAKLVSVKVRREVNRIPEATLVFDDGDIASGQYPLSEDRDLQPGCLLKIKAGEGDNPPTEHLFIGRVVRQRLVAHEDAIQLHLDLRDAAIKLTSPRRSDIYRDRDDNAILTEIIEDAELNVEGLGADFKGRRVNHHELVRYDATDWDFILMRAEALGLLVRVVDGVVAFADAWIASRGSEDTHSLEIGGADVIEAVELELDGIDRLSAVVSRGWDPQEKTATDAVRPPDTAYGDTTKANEIARALGFGEVGLDAMVPLEDDELKAWVRGRVGRDRTALVRGRVRLPGPGTYLPLEAVRISRVGNTFSRIAIIGAVNHRIDLEGWRIDLELGVSARPFAREPDIVNLPAGGLLPPVTSLQIGVVSDYVEDQDGDGFRIRVTLPSFDDCVWARVAWPNAGKGRGFVTWPSVGDEVVLGFLNEDPRHAVVLGSLYGKVNTAPIAPSETSSRKYVIQIQDAEDEQKSSSIAIDADAKTIIITDPHENNITLDDKGMTISTPGDLMLSGKNVKITAESIDFSKKNA